MEKKNMIKLEFGISPKEPAEWAWGARAIFRREGKEVVIDLVFDRCAWGGEANDMSSTLKDKGAHLRRQVADWIGRKGGKLFEKMVRDGAIYPDDQAEVIQTIDGYDVTVSPRKSFGYLYIGIWPTTLPVQAAKDAEKAKVKRVKRTKRLVVIEPGEAPKVVEVAKNDLYTLQKYVDGYIEEVSFRPRRPYTVYVNEEGLLKNLPFNREVAGHRLHGTIVIDQVKGMDDAMIERVLKEWGGVSSTLGREGVGR